MQTIKEIIFLVEETDDGYIAQALGHSIFTQADTLDELKEMVKDAVECHFDEEERPKIIRLHIVRQEVITV
ncbi:type II toxin-antitoxin system HicB family antitoxin [Archaeoglobus neptunius]|uniref:type II toxin-antitoxin system HicB family antitoxin n=1 Tax=Archaeoglobus neptunius TaxID=2798580 RepID=UPI001E39B9C0|nr:2-oxoisovalerate dehydrogenase [Archaeoglobus neptunius]